MNNGNVDWNNRNNNYNVRAVTEFQKNMTIESLYEAYWKCRENKANTRNALRFEVNYEERLAELHAEVTARTYTPGRSRAFIVTKPVIREIFAADFRDRIIHHWICTRTEPLFENVFVPETFNCRTGKGNLAGINHVSEVIRERSENYTRSCWVMKLDMQGFFMSINRRMLTDKLCRFVEAEYIGEDKETLLYLIEVIYMNDPVKNCIIKGSPEEWNDLPKTKSLFHAKEGYGLPIGNLTSQMAANYLLNDTDHYIKSLGLRFARYVDDICLVDRSKEKLLASVPLIRKHLTDNAGVVLHPDKFYLQHYTKGVDFIGGTIKRERKYISNRTVGSAFKKIHGYNKQALRPGFIEKHAEDFAAAVNSYLGMMTHFRSYAIRKRLVSMIAPEWLKVLTANEDFTKLTVKSRYKQSERMKYIVRKQRRQYLKANRKG